MTDRVSNEADLVVLERYLAREPHLWWAARTQEVINSHRLQAARIQELEQAIRTFITSFKAEEINAPDIIDDLIKWLES